MSTTGALDRWREAGLVAVLSCAVAIASFVFQPQLAVNDGQGWDGASYYLLADESAHGQLLTTDAPFVYRIAVPLMAAAILPNDLMLGFKVVNGVAVAVTIVLLVVWLRLFLASWLLRATLVSLFLIQWTGPVRTFFWYPVLVDYWLLPAILVGLLAIERLRRGGRPEVWLPVLCVVSMFGVTVRESGLLIPLATLFTYNPIAGRLTDLKPRLRELSAIPRMLALPLVTGGVTFAVIRILLVSTSSYAFARAAVGWILRKWPNIYLLAWFIAFGPILVVPLFYWRACWRFLREHQAIGIFLLALCGISYIGGGDTERFVTWGAPVIYLLVGIGLEALFREQVSLLFLAILAVSQAISARLFWVLPAVPLDWEQVSELVILTPIGHNVSIYNVTAWDAAPAVRLASELEYAVVAAQLLGLLMLRHRRTAHAPASGTPLTPRLPHQHAGEREVAERPPSGLPRVEDEGATRAAPPDRPGS